MFITNWKASFLREQKPSVPNEARASVIMPTMVATAGAATIHVGYTQNFRHDHCPSLEQRRHLRKVAKDLGCIMPLQLHLIYRPVPCYIGGLAWIATLCHNLHGAWVSSLCPEFSSEGDSSSKAGEGTLTVQPVFYFARPSTYYIILVFRFLSLCSLTFAVLRFNDAFPLSRTVTVVIQPDPTLTIRHKKLCLDGEEGTGYIHKIQMHYTSAPCLGCACHSISYLAS